MKLDEIRDKFLEFFVRNGHEAVKSSSLIPEGDPTLLFTNAGMNQFKDVFLGEEKRSYNRAVTAQKCFRASGKHNDLENVGRTARHHTFFEMLGNFSFGDYFKQDAIAFSWELMTKDYGLPKELLWITVYKDDDEAHELWKKVAAVPESRILRLGDKDNFWAMGETGPCGPCSEIHFDQGPAAGCGRPDCHVECECDRYLELWNLVFMQYDRDKAGVMHPLPRPSIDTGMGVERIAAVLQGVHSNYDIDHFQTIIARISDLANSAYGQDAETDVSLRVIADHARSMAFLIADGVLPSNEGRGYVLRRVMRRAARHAKMLGKDDPVLYRVADTVIDLMGGTYPELMDKRAFLMEVIRKEEERFLETLGAGLKILQEEMAAAERKKDGRIPGEVAFKLYDTYGFPFDLTQTIAEENGLAVDQAGFDKAMAEQRERARESWKGSGEERAGAVYKEIKSEVGETEFLGYETTETKTKVKALVVGGERAESVSREGAEFQLIVDRTPFYGESGGQAGDVGAVSGDGLEADVTDAKKPIPGLTVHHCLLRKGAVKTGDAVELEVNPETRGDTARNHSATHVLQHVLREVLGDHVHQKGSLVTPDRLRFDLTHYNPVTAAELRTIETLVNKRVRENAEVRVEIVPYKQAVERGATALFGEKYGDEVRMVEMGDFSRELCGGTHARRTGDIGVFKVLSESGVAAGVRRIEALTGRAAVEHMQSLEDRIWEAAECLKSNPEELKERIERLQDEVKKLKKEAKAAREGKLGAGGDLFDNIEELNGVKVLVASVEVESAKELRPMGDRAKDKMKSGVAVLAAAAGGKAHLLAVVTDDLTKKIRAGDIVKEIAGVVGGKGGGRPDFAQAGGPDEAKIEEALERAREMLAEKLS